eukprot:5030557-Prymnesium_polylepis.1
MVLSRLPLIRPADSGADEQARHKLLVLLLCLLPRLEDLLPPPPLRLDVLHGVHHAHLAKLGRVRQAQAP